MASSLSQSYRHHLSLRQQTYERVLSQCGFSGVVIAAGISTFHFADDQEIVFRANPHFTHWLPESSPFHLLVIRPGATPRLLFYSPQDFWHDQPSWQGAFWAEFFDIIPIEEKEKLSSSLGRIDGFAFIGPENALPTGHNLVVNPPLLLSHLDWERGLKSDYEVSCLVEATARGAAGHRAAREVFAQGGSELDAHYAFVKATGTTETELPYPTIIGMDEKSAILHYRSKQVSKNHKVMLIDAGARASGYCSDITRTYQRRRKDSPLFASLLAEMESLQQKLCSLVGPEISFLELHRSCIEGIGKILLNSGIIKNCSLEVLNQHRLAEVFFPHSLGHMLGIQVHDVGGKQINAAGESSQAADYPSLRTLRKLRSSEVVTIEPGLYFIPLKLEPQRQGPCAQYFSWETIDNLLPLGGIRIEDDILVTANGCRNLTREHLGNEFLLE